MRSSLVSRGSVGPTASVGARLGLSVAALALASGCLDYQFRVVKPESTQEVKRAVAAAKPTPVDILFVVDNSGSMADEQANLARNFSEFINVLTQGAGNDYQIAVVSTDVLSRTGEQGGDVDNKYSTMPPYFVTLAPEGDTCGSVGIDHGCFRGGSMKVVRSSMPAAQQISAFQENVRVGTCGIGSELGMQAMALALENTRPNGCNAGFLRPEANLVVVIVSDEENSANDDVSDYARRLVEAKGSAERVRVALIVGSKDGEPANCGATEPCGVSACMGTPPPGSMAACGPSPCLNPEEICDRSGQCLGRAAVYQRFQFNAVSPVVGCQSCSFFNTPDCCSAVAGTQYIQFARAVERRVNMADPSIAITQCKGSRDQRVACLVASICEAEFGETLIRIARDLVISNTFALDPPAKYPPGVVVEVNGQPLVNCASVQAGQECGFTVTPNGGSVSLRVQPAETDKVEVFFVVEE
jgi:hypothetical protein